MLPNSLLFLAAVLERAGHQVQIFDGQVDRRQPADFAAFDPQLVGLSVLSGPNIAEAIEISQAFKEMNPNFKVVWGNVHPSVLPRQTLAEPVIDFLVIGPGEDTLLELVSHLEAAIPL